MSDQLQNLIHLQRQRMLELRDDAVTLANSVADEVWDKFEVEVEETTSDGYMFDFAASTQMSLASLLSMSYDDVFERCVISWFERLEKQLNEAGAVNGSFDSARVNLAGLRKSLKLRRHADKLIGQAIGRAKPGLLGQIFLSSDPCSDAWDREHLGNANRLRRQLLALRPQIVNTIQDEAGTVIQTARLAYTDMLDKLTIGTSH